jgi:hypothetical protein
MAFANTIYRVSPEEWRSEAVETGIADRTVPNRTAPIIGKVTAAVDGKNVGGTLFGSLAVRETGRESDSLYWRSARKGQFPIEGCSATLTVAVTAFADCRSTRWRQRVVCQRALVRGE